MGTAVLGGGAPGKLANPKHQCVGSTGRIQYSYVFRGQTSSFSHSPRLSGGGTPTPGDVYKRLRMRGGISPHPRRGSASQRALPPTPQHAVSGDLPAPMFNGINSRSARGGKHLRHAEAIPLRGIYWGKGWRPNNTSSNPKIRGGRGDAVHHFRSLGQLLIRPLPPTPFPTGGGGVPLSLKRHPEKLLYFRRLDFRGLQKCPAQRKTQVTPWNGRADLMTSSRVGWEPAASLICGKTTGGETAVFGPQPGWGLYPSFPGPN